MSVFSRQGTSAPPATSVSATTTNPYSDHTTTMVNRSATTAPPRPAYYGEPNSLTPWSNRTGSSSNSVVRPMRTPTTSMTSPQFHNNWNGKPWSQSHERGTATNSSAGMTSNTGNNNTSRSSVPITPNQGDQSQQGQHPAPRHELQDSQSHSQLNSNDSPGKPDLAAQLLQLVGLPMNLAGHLVPQTFEQKKRVRQAPIIPHTVAQTDSPLVPKPGAPLPANLVDDIPGALSSNRIRRPSQTKHSSSTRLTVTSNSDSKSTNISGILRNSSTSTSSNTKRMSLQDYKSREGSARTANETSLYTPTTEAETYIATNVQNTPVKDAEGFVIPSALNASYMYATNSTLHETTSTADERENYMTSIQNQPVKDAEGFVIPNAFNTSYAKNSKLHDNTSVSENYMTANVQNISEKDSEGFVIPNAFTTYSANSKLNTSPDPVLSASTNIENGKVNLDINVGADQLNNSSDELDTSLDELVIDETVSEEVTVNSPQPIVEQVSDNDVPYQPKSKQDINEISMELDELINNLDTDGTLLMDRKMRRKLRKLMRKQRRRDHRAKRPHDKDDEAVSDTQDKEDEMVPSDDEQLIQHAVSDKEEIDYPDIPDESQQLGDETEKSSEDKDSPKFKTLKHKHIIRKYRQRELEFDKRQKKREKEPLSEGEISSDESDKGAAKSDIDSATKESDESNVEIVNTKSKERVSQKLDLDYWESNWVENMPDSPNELKITFTVQINAKPKEITTTKLLKKTLAERSGNFVGELGLSADTLKDKKSPRRKSPRRKSPRRRKSSKESKSPDVIEIDDTGTFLDDKLSDISFSSSEEEDHRSSKQKHRRKRRRSSRQSKRQSRSRSRSPRAGKRSHSHSPNRKRRSRSCSPHKVRTGKPLKSRSRSPKRGYRSNSRSPGRHRKLYRRSYSRSRSRSPTRARKLRSRSYSRSPPRKNKDRQKRNERRRSRSQSRSRSPPRDLKDPITSSNRHSKSRRSPSPKKCDGRSESISVVDDDRNLEDLSMEISSGGDTPPLSINTEKAEEDEISRQLEAAMAKLKKMEETVSQRQVVIEDLNTSDDESKELVTKSVEKTEEMDEQLIDAIHRLQKMEESYSQRQMLLNSLRKSILDAEKEAGLHKQQEKEESSDEETPSTPLPHVKPSTSAANQVPTSQVPKLPPSANQTSVPSTSTQPVPMKQPAPKSSRWDKPGIPPAKPTPRGNQTVPPVGNRIPSLLGRQVVRPPVSAQIVRPRPPVSAQRPPWNPNMHTGPPHPRGPPPSTSSRPPVPVTTAPPVPAQPSMKSKHQIVWLVGSSILCQAARYVANGPVGLGLMLNQAELVWHGHDHLKWAEFGPLLSRLMGSSISPSVLVVHMDAIELAKVSFQDLAQQAVESLLEFNRRNPSCRIIWSEALPCCHYPGSIAKMTMEQVRINYNVMCSKLVLSLGGQVIKHSAIRPETSALFDEDMMHLSDLGNNIFLNNLRRGLAFLLNEPKTKIYCASDDRTF